MSGWLVSVLVLGAAVTCTTLAASAVMLVLKVLEAEPPVSSIKEKHEVKCVKNEHSCQSTSTDILSACSKTYDTYHHWSSAVAALMMSHQLDQGY
jgi:hypothetical protein